MDLSDETTGTVPVLYRYNTLLNLALNSLVSRSTGPVVVRLAERANERERELSWLSRCYRCMCKAGDARTI